MVKKEFVVIHNRGDGPSLRGPRTQPTSKAIPVTASRSILSETAILLEQPGQEIAFLVTTVTTVLCLPVVSWLNHLPGDTVVVALPGRLLHVAI